MCIRDRALPALLIALLSALLIHCHEPLLMLLGTPGELMVPAREYLVWFTLFLAPLAVFNILMFIVRLDGAPGFAMACNIMAACINIALDYLFIFVFEWGLAGAAVATGIGLSLIHIFREKSPRRLRRERPGTAEAAMRRPERTPVQMPPQAARQRRSRQST